MILIGSKFVILWSFSFILPSTSPLCNAQSITVLGVCIIMIGSQFVISSSFGFILHNALPVLKAENKIELGLCMILIGKVDHPDHLEPPDDVCRKDKSLLLQCADDGHRCQDDALAIQLER
jgi:hypothetical protein